MSEQSEEIARPLIARAQQGDPRTVISELQVILADPALSDDDRLMFLYVRAVAEVHADDEVASARTTRRALTLADRTGHPHWMVSFLCHRAQAHIRAGRVDGALDDLVAAEAALGEVHEGARLYPCHSAVAIAFGELRLYEFARPHFETTLALSASSYAEQETGLVDYANLVELHLVWSHELARVCDGDTDLTAEYWDHIGDAAQWCHQGLATATADPRNDDGPYLHYLRRVQVQLAAAADPAGGLADLEATLAAAQVDPDRRGDVVASRVALARALRHLDRHDEAIAHAQAAVEGTRGTEGSLRLSALHELHCASVAAGRAGARDSAGYITTLARAMWDQRLREVDGYRLRLELDASRSLHSAAAAEARIDPLTGIANRRAIDEWLVDHPVGPATMYVIDLDSFKGINDDFGHATGDQVLVQVAAALRSIARRDDLLARYGGDEFVIASVGIDDPATIDERAERITSAIDQIRIVNASGRVRVKASIGADAVGPDTSTTRLLTEADGAMFAAKGRLHERSRRDSD